MRIFVSWGLIKIKEVMLEKIDKIVNFEHDGIEVTGNYYKANSFEYCLTLREKDEINYKRNNCSFFVAVPNPNDVNNRFCIDSDVRSLNEYLRLSTLAYDNIINKIKTDIIKGYDITKNNSRKFNDLTRNIFVIEITMPNPLKFRFIRYAHCIDCEEFNPEGTFFDEKVEQLARGYRDLFIEAEMQVIEIHEDMKRLHIKLMEHNYLKLKEEFDIDDFSIQIQINKILNQ